MTRNQHDFYPTPYSIVDTVVRLIDEHWDVKGIWEPCAGDMRFSSALSNNDRQVISTDIRTNQNFYWYKEALAPALVTNPPFNKAFEFVEHSIKLVKPNQGKVAMFLRLAFAESKRRKEFFLNNRPTYIYVFSERQTLWRDGDPIPKGRSGTTAYAWWVWDLSEKKQFNKTIFDWI